MAASRGSVLRLQWLSSKAAARPAPSPGSRLTQARLRCRKRVFFVSGSFVFVLGSIVSGLLLSWVGCLSWFVWFCLSVLGCLLFAALAFCCGLSVLLSLCVFAFALDLIGSFVLVFWLLAACQGV